MKTISILALMTICAFFYALSGKDEQRRWVAQLEQDEQTLNQIKEIEPYPIKTAAYWTSPIMRAEDLMSLARHDIVIADLENMFNNRASLLQLKGLNPKLLLLAYSNPMEIWTTRYSSRPWQNKVINEIINNRQKWLLKTVTTDSLKGDFAVFWPGMVMLNLSSACPKINGKTYGEWMAEKISTEILSDPIWDGYFQDNGTVNISWVYPNPNQKIDINGDGQPDPDAFVDRKWKEGIEKYLSIIVKNLRPRKGFWNFLAKKHPRDARDEFFIITNKGDTNLLQFVDGKFFEKFPNDYLGDKWAGGWLQCVNNARITGPLTIFQVNRAEINFGLASALLFDNIYLAVSQDDAGVFPQLYLDLGKPLNSFQRKGNIFVREYEHYRIRVDPLNRFGEIIPRAPYVKADSISRKIRDSIALSP